MTHIDAPSGGKGVNPSIAQGAGFRTIRRGDPVSVDFVGNVGGYLIDQTRLMVLGDLDEGLAEGFHMARQVQEWALARGFGLFAAEGYRSKTVTTVANTLNVDFGALNSYLMERGMRIANGYGALKNKTFRIAHMGELQMADIQTLLASIDSFLG